MMDYHSNWLEIVELNRDITAKHVTAAIKSIFFRFGVAEELVSDNGPPLDSRSFREFAATFGFQHTTSLPYHSHNEKAVAIAKSIICKTEDHSTALM